MKSNQLRPSGAWIHRREERLHGKCGDWRTLLSYPAFLLKRKQDSLLLAWLLSFVTKLNDQKKLILFRDRSIAVGNY